MSLIDIRMDNAGLSIDGYYIGCRTSTYSKRICPLTTWDAVAQVLDGFDIDEPERLKQRIAQLEQEVKDLTAAVHVPDV